ncbi:unnamed protein product [Chrysoparadoxa australica]
MGKEGIAIAKAEAKAAGLDDDAINKGKEAVSNGLDVAAGAAVDLIQKTGASIHDSLEEGLQLVSWVTDANSVCSGDQLTPPWLHQDPQAPQLFLLREQDVYGDDSLKGGCDADSFAGGKRRCAVGSRLSFWALGFNNPSDCTGGAEETKDTDSKATGICTMEDFFSCTTCQATMFNVGGVTISKGRNLLTATFMREQGNGLPTPLADMTPENGACSDIMCFNGKETVPCASCEKCLHGERQHCSRHLTKPQP